MNIDSLDIHFDWWKGEAHVDPLIEPMIDELKKDGIAVMDEGALIVRVEEPGDQKELPPLILLKSDGAVLYGTTDLATIIDRACEATPILCSMSSISASTAISSRCSALRGKRA